MPQITQKIHEIANVIFHDMETGKLNLNNSGLFSGQMGIIIFCKHYLRCFPDLSYEAVLNSYLDSFFDRLSSGMDIYTYDSGLIGILGGLEYLKNENLLDIDYSEIENAYKDLLQQFSLWNIRNMNYDYLHGGLGVLSYFSNDIDYANQAIQTLDETSVKERDTIKWVSRLGASQEYGYNISLSHGISSIVSILVQLKHPKINQKVRNRLLDNACNYLLTQKVDPKIYGCYFPNRSLTSDPEGQYSSRLAWCYGDLGVATSLWQAGKLLNKQKYLDEAIEVFTFSSNRRTLQQAMVQDAGLCHGSSSIAMMFHYIYQQTGKDIFKATRDYWLEIVLQMDTHEDGLAGYKFPRWFDNSWENKFDMLEGVAGIGLMLLSSIDTNNHNDGWMKFFMLN